MCHSDYKGICASPRWGAIEHAQDQATEASIEHVVAFDEGLIDDAELAEKIREELAYLCEHVEEHGLEPSDIGSVGDVIRWVREETLHRAAAIAKSVGAA